MTATSSLRQSGRSRGPPPRVNSPNCPVRSAAHRPQRRVPLRDVPRRFLDLQSVKTPSDGGILHWRLHGDVLVGFPVRLLVINVSPGVKFQPARWDLAAEIRSARGGNAPPALHSLPSGHVGELSFPPPIGCQRHVDTCTVSVTLLPIQINDKHRLRIWD